MKIQTLSLFILFAFFVNFGFSQTPVIEKPKGTPVPNYFIDNAYIQTVADLDDYVLFYQDNDFTVNKSGTNKLILYSKGNKEIQTSDLVIPEGNNYITSKYLNDVVYNFYYVDNLKSRTISLNKAESGIPESASGSTKLYPEQVFSYNVDAKTKTYAYYSESMDKKYFSICLTTLNEFKIIKNIFTVVYNDKMEIVWMDEFNPDFKGKQTDIADYKVTNSGKALLLLNTFNSEKKKQINHELQLISLNKDHDYTWFSNVTTFGIIQSMKLIELKNGKYFVGGYYCEKLNTTTAGYFTYTFDPRKEKQVLTSYSYKFNENYKEKIEEGFEEPVKPNTEYNLKCDYIWELSNDFVVMLGEQYLAFKTVDPKKEITIYTYMCKNLFYHQFGLDGINAGYDLYPKPQIGTSLKPITELSQLGLSYQAYLNQDVVYFIYNDHIKRIEEVGDPISSFNNEELKEQVVILTKIKKIGFVESKLILLPVKDFYFQKMWYADGRKIFFGATTKKTYDLEQFEIMNEWEWN
jgi:hypothetical protein